MGDENIVQTDTVSPDSGTVSPEAGTQPQDTGTESPPQEQPLTEEKVQQMIADAAKLAEERGVETGKRQMQGIKDREVADAQRRARVAESESASYKSSFGNLDEDARKEAELAQLRSRVQTDESLRKDEEAKKQQDAYFQNLHNSLLDNLKGLGIDPEDKRIEWAKDEPDYLKGRSKFDASVAKIIKENQKMAEDKQKEDFKSLESKLRKDLGLDSVDVSAPAGVDASEAKFIEEYNEGLRNSPADHKKAAEILSKT